MIADIMSRRHLTGHKTRNTKKYSSKNLKTSFFRNLSHQNEHCLCVFLIPTLKSNPICLIITKRARDTGGHNFLHRTTIVKILSIHVRFISLIARVLCVICVKEIFIAKHASHKIQLSRFSTVWTRHTIAQPMYKDGGMRLERAGSNKNKHLNNERDALSTTIKSTNI